MANTYSWGINALTSFVTFEGQDDVVCNVNWTRYAKNAQNRIMSRTGDQLITLNPDIIFTSYEDLTESQIINWVEGALGKEQIAEIDEELSRRLAEPIPPQIVTHPLPWE